MLIVLSYVGHAASLFGDWARTPVPAVSIH